VELTLDATLQRAAERLLRGARPVTGAIVAVEVSTGNVLVWTEWSSAGLPYGHTLERASAPAASVFKLVTAASLLQDAHVQPTLRVCVNGGQHDIGLSQLTRPKTGAALCAPFGEALGQSRSAVFAQLSHRFLDTARLQAMADRLGFNGPVPFDRTVPMGSVTFPDDSLQRARTAAGLRGSTLSPLGAVYLARTLARGGRQGALHILEPPQDEAGPGDEAPRVLGSWATTQLERMMERTVHGGTALDAFSDPNGRSWLGGIRVAGKTGTLANRASTPPTMTSWFVGFAPARRPRIAFAVLLNNGEAWRNRASELGRDLLRAYFAERGTPGVTSPFDPDASERTASR